MEVSRKRCRELDSLHARGGNCSQQARERRRSGITLQTLRRLRPITIHVLAEQMDFLVAERAKSLHLGNNLQRVATLLTSARVRNDAEGTKLITPFNDWHKRNVR